MNYHIVYNNFKDYAELFIKNIDFSKANINKVLFLHIGDEEAISEIIENTNFKNAEFYIKDEDSIYDIIETLYNEKVHKFLEYNNMEFDLIIANPPYGNLGNPIISEAIEHLTDNGTASVLMPLSCYKKNELYRHVETFELANPKLFKDATISNNLCICNVKKWELNKYTLDNIELASFDKAYTAYYMYNMNSYNKYKLVLKTMSYKKPEDFDIDKDFWESSRCVHHAGGGGGGFGNEGGGYKWNMLHDNSNVNAGICAIHFDTKQIKDNFCKWWYKDYKLGMACKVIHGLNLISTGPSTRFAIPQIDWLNIHINQKELWDKGLYDEAVLSEMHLKWNDDKTKIIQA